MERAEVTEIEDQEDKEGKTRRDLDNEPRGSREDDKQAESESGSESEKAAESSGDGGVVFVEQGDSSKKESEHRTYSWD
jgi:hypothetical protein